MPLFAKASEPDVMRRQAQPDPAGREHLHQMLRKRIGDSLITAVAREILIENSGGVTRLLIGLTNQAAVSALSRGAAIIEEEDANFVADEQYKAFTAPVT